jgi:phosphoribosylformylglycinamidine (FGAM) synthase PurS component
MRRVDVYLKLEMEVDEKDAPEKLAGEICRQLLKNYGVRAAEVSNVVEKD